MSARGLAPSQLSQADVCVSGDTRGRCCLAPEPASKGVRTPAGGREAGQEPHVGMPMCCAYSSSRVPCTENDYKLWSPSDDGANECLLGHKTVFKRRTPTPRALTEKTDRPVVVSNCSCTREDYEWLVCHPLQGLSALLAPQQCGQQAGAYAFP